MAAAYMLLFAIELPSFVQLEHLYEDHEHSFCGNASTHLHEQEVDCNFSKFFVTTFYQSTNLEFNLHAPNISTLEIESYHAIPISKISHSYLLRGPPTV